MKELLEKAMTNKCNIAGNDDYTSLDIQLQNGLEAAMKEKDNFNVLQDVLNQFLAKNKNKSGGAAGYSGRFDVRSYVRNQFTSKKYFARPGEGELFKANNLKLNLIIDRSGSFSCNEPIINGFIYKLKELENKIPNFKFDVATFGLGCKLEHKEGLYIYCYDGTRWDDSCNEVIRKMRTPGFTNVTIICVDGTWGDPLECHFSEFNNSNTIFVSDRSNKNNIESYAPKAKSIILRKNYAEEFIKESIKVIKEVLR